MPFGCPAKLTDQCACFPSHPGHEASAIGGFRVTVGIIGKHFLEDEALNLVECAAGCDIVCVNQGLFPIRPDYFRVRSNEPVEKIGCYARPDQTRTELRKRGFALTCRYLSSFHGSFPLVWLLT